MRLPFTIDQFYAVFRDYNEALWPSQIGLVVLAIAAIIFLFRPRPWTDAAVSGILAFFWIWIGLAYQLAFFARINPLAYAFAGLAMLGGLAFLWQGVLRRRLRFQWTGDKRAFGGAALIFFALFVYPAWSWFAGHRYPFMPTFGLPCPTTIFTIGLLAFLKRPYPRSIFIVPILWCLVGSQAAFLLGVPQDLGLIIAGTAGVILMVRNKHSYRSTVIRPRR